MLGTDEETEFWYQDTSFRLAVMSAVIKRLSDMKITTNIQTEYIIIFRFHLKVESAVCSGSMIRFRMYVKFGS